MQALIPAAGKGTRLGSLSADRPKALVEVAGEPILAHCLRTLGPLEPSEVVVVVSPDGGNPIRERFGDRHGDVPLRYVIQERADGMARAFLAAEEAIRGPFMVLYGDNILRADLRHPVRRLREEALDAVLVTERVPPEEARQGVCLTDGEGRVRRVVEHPDEEERKAGLVLTGFHVFSPAIFDACRRVSPSEQGEYEVTDAIDVLLGRDDRRVEAVPLDGWRVNVNTPEDRTRAERRLAREADAPAH